MVPQQHNCTFGVVSCEGRITCIAKDLANGVGDGGLIVNNYDLEVIHNALTPLSLPECVFLRAAPSVFSDPIELASAENTQDTATRLSVSRVQGGPIR